MKGGFEPPEPPPHIDPALRLPHRLETVHCCVEQLHTSRQQGRIEEERACDSRIACIDGEVLAITIDSKVSEPEWPYIMASWFASLY